MSEKSSPPVDGKVLRLHFACHAELPFGSSLRVTSSEAWDTTAAAAAAASTGNCRSNLLQPSSSNIDEIEDDDLDNTDRSSLHSSSVEMVTTPETYPLWKTRNPVIRVVNNIGGDSGGIFRHRYRYEY